MVMVSSGRGCDSPLGHDCLGVTPFAVEIACLPACCVLRAATGDAVIEAGSIHVHCPTSTAPGHKVGQVGDFYGVRDTCAAGIHGAPGCSVLVSVSVCRCLGE